MTHTEQEHTYVTERYGTSNSSFGNPFILTVELDAGIKLASFS